MGSCCQTTVSSAVRLSSLGISGEAQLGLASSTCPRVNICLCASSDRLGEPRREKLRTVPELDQMALSHLPSTGYPENWGRVSDMSFTLVGRSSSSKHEEESSFTPLLPFPARLLHRVYSFCFVFPATPSSALTFLPSPLPMCSSAPSCHSKGWHFWKMSRYFSYFYSAWHKVKIWVSWLCSVRFFAASVLPLKNTHLILETPVLTLVLLMRSRKTHSA